MRAPREKHTAPFLADLDGATWSAPDEHGFATLVRPPSAVCARIEAHRQLVREAVRTWS